MTKLATVGLTNQVVRARLAREELVAAARDRPTLFAQMVLRDEKTNTPVQLASIHKAWHRLATQHDRLVIWSHTEAGKTQQMAIARPLWEIGRDHNLRVCILSNTYGQATKIVRAIADYVVRSDDYKAIFAVEPGDLWNESALTIKRPSVGAKDPTVQATGVHGNILGSRIDLLIIDDILDVENCRTPEQRLKLWEWLQATVMGRLTPGARVIVIGTAFHPGTPPLHEDADALHRLAALPGWAAVRYPVIDDDRASPTFGQSRWPERWPLTRVEFERGQRGAREFARTMLCQAQDDASAIFKQEWVNVCLRLGRDKDMAYGLRSLPPGVSTYTGVDLAVAQHSAADLTVLTTIAVHPSQRKELLWIEAGRWQGPEIVDRIKDTHARYHSLVMVENNAAQEFIVQYARGAGVPVKGYTTGRNKVHPEYGVQHLAAEMEGGQWIFPNRGGVSKELNALIGELLQYDPAGHTGDRIMSLWLAREAARLGNIRAEVARLNLVSR